MASKYPGGSKKSRRFMAAKPYGNSPSRVKKKKSQPLNRASNFLFTPFNSVFDNATAVPAVKGHIKDANEILNRVVIKDPDSVCSRREVADTIADSIFDTRTSNIVVTSSYGGLRALPVGKMDTGATLKRSFPPTRQGVSPAPAMVIRNHALEFNQSAPHHGVKLSTPEIALEKKSTKPAIDLRCSNPNTCSNAVVPNADNKSAIPDVTASDEAVGISEKENICDMVQDILSLLSANEAHIDIKDFAHSGVPEGPAPNESHPSSQCESNTGLDKLVTQLLEKCSISNSDSNISICDEELQMSSKTLQSSSKGEASSSSKLTKGKHVCDRVDSKQILLEHLPPPKEGPPLCSELDFPSKPVSCIPCSPEDSAVDIITDNVMQSVIDIVCTNVTAEIGSSCEQSCPQTPSTSVMTTEDIFKQKSAASVSTSKDILPFHCVTPMSMSGQGTYEPLGAEIKTVSSSTVSTDVYTTKGDGHVGDNLEQATDEDSVGIPNNVTATGGKDSGCLKDLFGSLSQTTKSESKLGCVVIGIACRIFRSSLSNPRMPEIETFSRKLMNEIKHEYWDSIHNNSEYKVYLKTDIKTVIDRVYYLILQDYESQAALENELRKENTFIFYNIANSIILEMMCVLPAVELSPDSAANSAEIFEFKDVTSEQDDNNLNTLERSSPYFGVYSAAFIENILSRLLCRIFTSPDNPIHYEDGQQSELHLCKILLTFVNSLFLYLKETDITLIRFNEKMPNLTPIDENIIETIVHSIYGNILHDCGSYKEVYKNITNEHSLFAEIIIDYLLVDISGYALERGASEDAAFTADTILDSDFIIQNILNGIGMLNQQSKTSQASVAIFLDNVIPNIISNVLEPLGWFSGNLDSKTCLSEEAFLRQLRKDIMKNISNGATWKINNSNVAQYLEEHMNVVSISEAVSTTISVIYRTPESIQAALSSGNETLHVIIGTGIVTELSRRLQRLLSGGESPGSSTLATHSNIKTCQKESASKTRKREIESKRPMLKEVTTSEVEAVTINKESLEAHDIVPKLPSKKSSSKRRHFTEGKPQKMHLDIINEPSTVSEPQTAIQLTSEPPELLKGQCLVQNDQYWDNLCKASRSMKSTSIDKIAAAAVYTDISGQEKPRSGPPLTNARAVDVKPRKLGRRNAISCVLKPETTNMDRAEDGNTKQKCVAEQVTHDIEQVAMNRAPCAVDRTDDSQQNIHSSSHDKCIKTEQSSAQKMKRFLINNLSFKGCGSTKTHDSQKVPVSTGPTAEHTGIESQRDNKSASASNHDRGKYKYFFDMLHFKNSNKSEGKSLTARNSKTKGIHDQPNITIQSSAKISSNFQNLSESSKDDIMASGRSGNVPDISQPLEPAASKTQDFAPRSKLPALPGHSYVSCRTREKGPSFASKMVNWKQKILPSQKVLPNTSAHLKVTQRMDESATSCHQKAPQLPPDMSSSASGQPAGRRPVLKRISSAFSKWKEKL